MAFRWALENENAGKSARDAGSREALVTSGLNQPKKTSCHGSSSVLLYVLLIIAKEAEQINYHWPHCSASALDWRVVCIGLTCRIGLTCNSMRRDNVSYGSGRPCLSHGRSFALVHGFRIVVLGEEQWKAFLTLACSTSSTSCVRWFFGLHVLIDGSSAII